MHAEKYICAVALCLAVAGLHAEGLGAPPSGSPDPQQNNNKPQEPDTLLRHGLNRNDLTRLRYRDTSSTWNKRTFELWNEGMDSLPEMRAKLAEEWQRLGLSAEQAKAVASAYRAVDRRLVHTESLEGKSSSEVAAMMQSALASKDYRQANQLLIDYERAKLNLEPIQTAKPGDR